MVFLEGQRKLTKQSQCGSTPKASHSFTNLFAMADIKDVGWLLGRLVCTWRRTVREGSSMKASLIERSASWCLPEHPRPAELQLNCAPSPELHVICIYIYNDTCACHSSSKSCCNSWQLNVTLERKISLPILGLAACPGKLDGHSGLKTGTHPDPRRESNHRNFITWKRSLNATRKRPLRLSRKRHRMGSRNLKEGGDHADPQGHCPPHGGTGRDSPW